MIAYQHRTRVFWRNDIMETYFELRSLSSRGPSFTPKSLHMDAMDAKLIFN